MTQSEITTQPVLAKEWERERVRILMNGCKDAPGERQKMKDMGLLESLWGNEGRGKPAVTARSREQFVARHKK